jgi:hypothetical protein
MNKKIFIVTYEGEKGRWFVVPVFDVNKNFTGEFAISTPRGETIDSFKKFKTDIYNYLANHPEYEQFLKNES